MLNIPDIKYVIFPDLFYQYCATVVRGKIVGLCELW